MRRAATVLATAVGLVVTASAEATQPVPPIAPAGGSLSASLSTAKANAKPVTWTLQLRTDLVCGQPGSTVVTFPARVSVPPGLATTAVTIDGKPAASIEVAAQRVTVTAEPPAGAICYVVAPGLVTIRFTARARIGNPASPGTYAVGVRHGRATYRATVHITA